MLSTHADQRRYADLKRNRLPGRPAALKHHCRSLDAKAKTKISKIDFRFSHAWYWSKRGVVLQSPPRTPLIFPMASKVLGTRRLVVS
jgi:hypothetical protein